jgi:hypothetical protein
VVFERPAIEKRILLAFEETPPRIPVLLGGSGSGRTSILLSISRLLGKEHSQYIDVERAASTPEEFYAAVTTKTLYAIQGKTLSDNEDSSARTAFHDLLSFLGQSRANDGKIATFLIDELLELRTFESFPGLRGVLRELLDTLAQTPNHFVLSTRFISRAHRLLRDAPDCFEVIHVPPLSPNEITTTLSTKSVGRDHAERTELGRIIHALTDGRPTYVQALAEALASMDGASSGDPVSALAAQLSINAHLSLHCRFCYELRLHRARGYGALKAILKILADEEPLTLTEISHRLSRTAGSTKDYLSWLQDVDLVSVRQKLYSFSDPLLRLWVKLHCGPIPPDESDLSREVQEYAVSRLPHMESTVEEEETPKNEKDWNLIKTD